MCRAYLALILCGFLVLLLDLLLLPLSLFGIDRNRIILQVVGSREDFSLFPWRSLGQVRSGRHSLPRRGF